MWQDNVIAICNFIFIVSMTYQVATSFRRRRCDISPFTSSVTSVALYVMAYTFFTLTLWWSALSSVVTATLWLLTLIQFVAYRAAPESEPPFEQERLSGKRVVTRSDLATADGVVYPPMTWMRVEGPSPSGRGFILRPENGDDEVTVIASRWAFEVVEPACEM